MFDGVPDQFHQFIAPRTTLPLHLSFPLHASATPNTFPPYDPYNPSSHHLSLPVLPNLLHPLHHHSPTHKHEEKEHNSTVSMNLEIQRETQLPDDLNHSWTDDELLALLRIRSGMESWFPELTWEHVSRKLAELGFKKSADKCKEKFEEESRYFNNINYSKNYRFISELEELYQADQNPEVGIEKSKQLQKPSEEQDKMGHPLEEDSRNDASVTKQCEESTEKTKLRKKKRHNKFEKFKGFCENMVNNMMAQQEEMHNKLLENMLKRDEEKFAREEAWKKQEIDRMNRELEMMAKEQAIAGDRQATIIEFLKKFAASSLTNQSFGGGNGKDNQKLTTIASNPNSCTSSPLHSKNPNPSCHYVGENNLEPPPTSTIIINHQDTGSSLAQTNPALPITCSTLAAENPSSSTLEVPSSSTSDPAHQKPNSLNSQCSALATKSISTYKASSSNPTSGEKDDVGRRWPREEVLSLINLRSSLNNINNEDKDGNRAPLWESISHGMSELGYRRSAKRCKEKWENINKYFRKTKDVSKKRSLDSRTCPYFHQLSTLYSQGKLENHRQVPPENQAESSQLGSSRFRMHIDGGEKTLMQVPPALDFDQL